MMSGLIKKIRHWLDSNSYKILFILVILGCSIFGSLLMKNQIVYADIPSTGYATATISNPSTGLTDFTLMVDLSTLPADWWTAVDTSDGTKGRAAKNDGTELAADWINFDNTGHTGWLRILWAGTLTSSGSQILKIYPPVSTNTSYGHADTYGSDNAYASHWVAYYTLDEAVNNNTGGYIDRTRNARNATGVSMAITASAGKVGNAQNFDGTADYIKYDNFTVDFTQGTILTWASTNANGTRTFAEVSPAGTTNRILFYYIGTTLNAFVDNANVATKASAISASTLANLGFTWNTATQGYELYVNGSAQNADLGVDKSLTTVARNITIGSYNSRSNYFLSGYEDEVQIHSTALSTPWIAEEYSQTNNNATFWGTWSWNTGLVGNPSAPTLVSPANGSSIADDTPTLSVQYSDDDTVGTANYRVASTDNADCLAGTNLVTNGASTQTATIDEATTFTPSLSIGSDGTYYWCAQNNNGTQTSDWTAMGAFTLDTTNPSIPGIPSADQNTLDNTPTWTWTASTDSGSGLHTTTPYTVEWSQDPNFISGVTASTASTNSFSHSDSLADGTWYFRVAAKDNANNESDFSAEGSVIIDTASFPGFSIDYISTDANGVKSYNMTSNYNGGGTHTLRVLEPDNPAPGVPHNFLYVLPVQAELGTTYGDGLDELLGADAQNEYNVTIIAPAFESDPWYADSDSNNNYRYESFMTLELQPWVKTSLAETGNEQHWLLGFSKSGFGPLHLLFRNPGKFTLGAFWDFPADMTSYSAYPGSATNYGTQINFDNNYRLSSSFLDNHKTPFLNDNRIWINGYGNFRTHVENFDALLISKNIQHTTAPEVSRAHLWNSGWIPSAVAGLYTNSQLSSTALTTTDNTDSNWHNADVTITLTCMDSLGSGCAHTYYTTDGTTPTTSSSQGTSVTISTNGSHTIKYFSIDGIGLQEAVKTAANTVKIDNQNPTVSSGDDQNKSASFTQTATASDGGSDINASTYQWAKVSGPGTITFGTANALSTTISADTDGTYVISFTASDYAGNSNSDNFSLTWTNPITTHTVTASAGSHGSISPSGATTVNDGDNQSYSITADSGYHISDVVVDGSSVGAVSSYAFNTVSANHTISATFAVTSSGGGGSPAMWTLPTVPQEGFKMSINGGVTTTSNRNVTLNFNAGADIKKMAISMTGDFTDASQENYVASKQWDLCSKLGGIVKNPTCPDGIYKVYAQFYTAYGRTTGNAFASSTITLKSGSITTENLQQYTNLPFTNPFTKYLQYRQTNTDIKRLQIFLNADPDTKIADTGAGSPGKETNYFGILTYKAVIKFQEKYAKDVLVPWGFKKGTGYVGKTTLAEINELMGNK